MSEIIRDIIWLPGRRVTAKEILQEVAHHHDLTVDEMLADSRKKNLAHARQAAMWEIRQRTKLSLFQIAKMMRRKDHVTIRHGIKRHEARLAEAQGREAA